jgi:hypothetical protein
MASPILRGSRYALASPVLALQRNPRNVLKRCIATTTPASGDASNLPLAGIKVLDMTRVLAGVSITGAFGLFKAHNSKAILHSNIGRPWVRDGQPCTDQHPRLANWTTLY